MEPPSKSRVTVLNRTKRRLRLEPIRRAVGVALQRHGRESCSINVLLTGDDEIQSLNLQFRNLDEPTDVLTFPTGDHVDSSTQGFLLGEIAISVPFAERQATARRVPLAQELAYLSIHGALHLVGFDDENEGDRREMIAEMNHVAIACGLWPDDHWYSVLHEDGRG